MKIETMDKPWTYSPASWLYANNVHQPWISEISGMQYAGLSKRAKKAYDEKRSREWQRASDEKEKWLELCLTAYDAGEFTLRSPGLNDEAKDWIERGLLKRKQDAAKAEYDKRYEENRRVEIANLEVGGKVWDFIARQYGTVIKKSKLTVRLKYERPLYGDCTEAKAQLGQLMYKNPDEIKDECGA